MRGSGQSRVEPRGRAALGAVVAAALFLGLASKAGASQDSYGVRDVSVLHVAVAQRKVPRSKNAILRSLKAKLAANVQRVTSSKTFAKAEKESGRSPSKRTRASTLAVAGEIGADYVVSISGKGPRGRETFSIQVLSVVDGRRVGAWKTADSKDPKTVGSKIGEHVLELLRQAPSDTPVGSDVRATLAAADSVARSAPRAFGGAPSRQPLIPSDGASPKVPGNFDDAASTAKDEREVEGKDGSAVAERGRGDPGQPSLRGSGGGSGGSSGLAADPDDPFSLASASMVEGDFTPVETVGASDGSLFEIGGLRFSLDARARFNSFSYFIKDPRIVGANKVNGRTALDLSAGGRLKGDVFAARAQLLFRNDFADPARRRFEPEELTASLDLSPVKILAGRSIVTWGRATLISPMDIICPLDGRDFLAREKLPVWLAEGSLTLGPAHVDLLAIPFFPAQIVDLPTGVGEDGRLASPNRWIDGAFPTRSDSGVPITYTFGQGFPRGKLTPDLQVGARLSATFLGIDAALSYVNQRDPFPSSRAEIVPSAEQNSITTTVDYHRRNVIGVDMESTAGRFHLVGEAALVLPSVPFDRMDSGTIPHLATVAGFDFRSPYFNENQEIRFFLEASGIFALKGALPNDPASPTAIITRGRFPFPLALSTRFNYTIGSVTLGLLAINNFGQFVFPKPAGLHPGIDLYLRPEIQVALYHHVQAIAGLDYLVGAPGEFFGGFRYNTRFSTSIQVYY